MPASSSTAAAILVPPRSIPNRIVVSWGSLGLIDLVARDGLDVQFAQLTQVDRGWSAGHQVHRLRGLRKRHDLANGRLSAQERNHPVDTERDAAVRWCAELERVKEESEA